MPVKPYDDVTLMAFADGELDPSTRAEIARAMASDETLRHRVEQFIASARLAKQAFEEELHEPVPEALAAAVRAASLRHGEDHGKPNPAPSSLPSGRGGTRLTNWLAGWFPSPLGMAVSLAVAALAGFLTVTWRAENITDDSRGALLSPDEWARTEDALRHIASGKVIASARDRIVIRHSVRDARGVLCREFHLDRQERRAVDAIACHDNRVWTVTFAQTSPSNSDRISPASATPALDSYLSSIGAGSALDPQEEHRVLAELAR